VTDGAKFTLDFQVDCVNIWRGGFGARKRNMAFFILVRLCCTNTAQRRNPPFPNSCLAFKPIPLQWEAGTIATLLDDGIAARRDPAFGGGGMGLNRGVDRALVIRPIRANGFDGAGGLCQQRGHGLRDRGFCQQGADEPGHARALSIRLPHRFSAHSCPPRDAPDSRHTSASRGPGIGFSGWGHATSGVSKWMRALFYRLAHVFVQQRPTSPSGLRCGLHRPALNPKGLKEAPLGF
jgi:hypothetical protein